MTLDRCPLRILCSRGTLPERSHECVVYRTRLHSFNPSCNFLKLLPFLDFTNIHRFASWPVVTSSSMHGSIVSSAVHGYVAGVASLNGSVAGLTSLDGSVAGLTSLHGSVVSSSVHGSVLAFIQPWTLIVTPRPSTLDPKP